MGPGLTALLVFIALIIIWAVVLKRNIVEAAILSLIILPFFGGVDQAPSLMSGAIKYVLNYEVLYASLAFIVMAFLLQHSNVLDGMLHIFTRLFGRLKGGPAYVNTAISSALGCMSGGNTPNAATAGAFTAEWLLKSGWNREQAATLIAANGGLGAGFPPAPACSLCWAFPRWPGSWRKGRYTSPCWSPACIRSRGVWSISTMWCVRTTSSPLWWVSRGPSRKYSASMASV